MNRKDACIRRWSKLSSKIYWTHVSITNRYQEEKEINNIYPSESRCCKFFVIWRYQYLLFIFLSHMCMNVVWWIPWFDTTHQEVLGQCWNRPASKLHDYGVPQPDLKAGLRYVGADKCGNWFYDKTDYRSLVCLFFFISLMTVDYRCFA